MAYGDKRDYKKIDIYLKNKGGSSHYLASTTWSKTCKEAVAVYREKYFLADTSKMIFARFDKN